MTNIHAGNKKRIFSFLIFAGVFAASLLAMSGCRNIFLEEMFNHPKATTPGHASITAIKAGTKNLGLNKRIFTLAYKDIAPSVSDEIPIQAALAGRRLDVDFILFDPEDNKTSFLTPSVNGTIWAVSITLKENKTLLLTMKVNAGRPDEVSYELTLERLIGSADNSLLGLTVSNSGKSVTFTDDGNDDHVPSIMTPAYAPLGYPDTVTLVARVISDGDPEYAADPYAKVSGTVELSGGTTTALNFTQANEVWTATGVPMPDSGETAYVKLQVKVPQGAVKSYTIELHRPTTYFVAATGEDNPFAGEDPSTPFKTLKKAIDVVKTDTHADPSVKLKNITVIGVLNEISEEGNSPDSVFAISNAGEITISGMNGGALKRTADGGNKRVVYVSGTSNITFKDITISGGNPGNDLGGGMYVASNAQVRLDEGTVVTANKVSGTGTGGGVSVAGTLTLDGGVISKNESTGGGGGIAVGNAGNFVMESGRIVLNKTTNSNGAGVMLLGTPSQFTMNGGEILMNEVVVENSNEYYGGGVYISSAATFTMNDGTISGNAGKTGMGIGVYQAGTFTMTNQAVVGNNDDVRLVSGKKIQLLGSGIAGDMTGAALQYGATITPPSYEVGTQLLAVDSSGNALNGIDDVRYGRFFVTPNGANPYAIDKFGQLCNGMFYLSKDGDDDNNGMTMGTAFKTLHKVVEEVKKINISVVVVDGKLDAASEAGYSNTNSVFVLDNVGELSFKGSKGDAEFCGTTTKRVFEITGNSSVTFEQIKITNGKAPGSYGGGMYLNGTGVNVTLGAGTEVSGNAASTMGGGIYVKNANLTLSAGTIKQNTANTLGGGIYLESGSFTMIGGAIGGPASSDFNAARDAGGGLYIAGGQATLGYGASIQYNSSTTTSTGGGIHVSGGSFTMTDGEIKNNKASTAAANVKQVGGTIIIQTTPLITSTHTGDIPGGGYVWL